MPSLSDIAQLNDETMQTALAKARAVRDENARTTILLRAIEQVRDRLSDVKVSNMTDKVSVKNLDEVRLSLRQELSKAIKPLLGQFEALNLSKEQINKIKEESDLMAMKAFDDNFDTLIVKRPKQRFSVDNLTDIQFPDEISVNNLGDVQAYFDNLAQVIRDTFNVEIPAPQVTVNPPTVNVPEASITVLPPDLSPLLSALDPLKHISNKANKPIAVRFSDGTKFQEAIRTIVDNQEKQMQAFTGGMNAAANLKNLKSVIGSGKTLGIVYLGSGNSNIGDVDVASIAAGDNNIGNVDIASALPAGTNAIGKLAANSGVDIGDVDVASITGVTMSNDAIQATGDEAHDAVDAGNPIKVGGKALTAQPTAVAANDRVNAMFDVYGRQVSIGALREMKGSQITTITASTSETTVVTADATYKQDVYGVIVTNTSDTATEVSFKDDTAGTTRFTISAPANDTRGFMLPMDAAHLQGAVNDNWTATAADSISSLIITVLFVKNL